MLLLGGGYGMGVYKCDCWGGVTEWEGGKVTVGGRLRDGVSDQSRLVVVHERRLSKHPHA